MKRPSFFRRQRSSASRRKPLGLFSRAKRKPKTYSFERLEDRCVLSAAPLELQFVSFSNDTPEGELAIWMREMEWAARQAASMGDIDYNPYTFMSLPNDPMFPFQWHLLNTGQEVGNPDFQIQPLFGVPGEDINVVPVWNMGYTGEGVVVAVLDTGVQFIHPDLVGNIDPTRRFNANNGSSNVTPSLIDFDGFHGTAVAGLIGATWNNLGAQLVDASGEPVFDRDGNPVFSGGGVGVAPGVTLVPIKLDFSPFGANPLQFQNAFQYVIQNDIDITNNSWGPNHRFNRLAFPLTQQEAQILRDSVIFGRDGLGIINVFASGNDGGPDLSSGFGRIGNYDSSSYNAWVNSRYTIGVTGVDHTGLYANPDGTITTYPVAGPSVLVAAPTGSNIPTLNIAEDDGLGSGIWTTDLIGDFGLNAAPLPNGFDPDRDYWPDPDYTSRMNGTSASAPIATGVIALMLEANPNLTYRDVQEILVRSARQNAQFEIPSTGTSEAQRNTWITNQTAIFREPDFWFFPTGIPDLPNPNPSQAIRNPLADPFQFGHYEPQPYQFTNGAGYTVSQGYGVFGEQVGYGHGVIDAELAVLMAEQWHILGQNLNPRTERTFTTFFVPDAGTGSTGLNLPAAERMSLDNGGMLVPGGIGGRSGFINFWDEYFKDLDFDENGNLTAGPFDGDSPPTFRRGSQFLEFSVPEDQAINIEWAEVKIEIAGPTENLDHLRIMLESPTGTHSELHNWYVDPGNPSPHSLQPGTGSGGPLGDQYGGSGWQIQVTGDINPSEGNFVWTFSTNRHWGETTSDAVIIDPITGEPYMGFAFDPDLGVVEEALTRGWRLHIENWGTEALNLQGFEIVWHGKPIEGETALDGTFTPAQRVQGFVGIDINGDNDFNYNRYEQFYIGADPLEIRALDVVREMDLEQEPFAANILVEAFRVVDGQVQSLPTARFLTGHDGNFYFDLVPGEYVIRALDPLGRDLLNDVDTGAGFKRHFQSEWHITEDWFFAPAREDLLLDPDRFGAPGEVFFDDVLGAPVKFTGDFFGGTVPMGVKDLNFLLKDPAPINEFLVTGTVIADLNANGRFDGDDVPAEGIFVYWDVNRNGAHDAGELMVMTDADGKYTLTISTMTKGTFQVGIIPPSPEWIPTGPGDVREVFAGPGSPPQVVDFFIKPPNNLFPPAGFNDPTDIFGVVFNDLNKNGMRNGNEPGIPGISLILVDINSGAQLASTTTVGTGGFHFANVPPNRDAGGNLAPMRIIVQIDGGKWRPTLPSSGIHVIDALGPGGTITGLVFGLENLADRDWGNLPDSYLTTKASGGPSHKIFQNVRLGSSVAGDVNGKPGTLDPADDGVKLVSNNGILQPGDNVFEISVVGFGGYLTGWIDWTNKGHFDEATDRLIWRDADGNILGGEIILQTGTHTLQVVAPADLVAGPLAARFRWGEAGLSFHGSADIGEVEDYLLFSLIALPGDYNNDGSVGAADYVLWRKTSGTNTALPNRLTVGNVGQDDYDVWRENFGASSGAGASQAMFDGGESSEAPVAPVKSEEEESVSSASLTTEDSALAQQAAIDESDSTLEPPMQSDSSYSFFAAQSVTVVEPQSAQDVASVDSAMGLLSDAVATPVAAAASLTSGPLLSVFAANGAASIGPAAAAAVFADESATLATGAGADLLLLDQAWAEFDDRTHEADLPLYDRALHDHDGAGELELAAVFEDQSNWWAGV